MKIEVTQEDLQRELQVVKDIVPNKTSIPILSNILLKARSGRLDLYATDLDVSITTGLTAGVETEGALTVPGRRLSEIVALLSPGPVRISTKGEVLHVEAGRSRFKLNGIPEDNFPAFPRLPWEEPNRGQRLSLFSELLTTLIRRTAFAMTQDESRYTLSGSLFILGARTAVMVATDGHRLALARHPVNLDLSDGEVRTLAPKRALSLVPKVAPDQGVVDFGRDETHLFFAAGDRVLMSRILTGQFPNYDLVIPKDNDKIVSLPAGDLIDTLRRLDLVTDERSHAAKFTLEGQTLTVQAQNSDLGEGQESVGLSAVNYDGQPVEFGFNTRYVMDFLKAVGAERCSIHWKDNECGVLWQPEPTGEADRDKNREYLYVVMPLRF